MKSWKSRLLMVFTLLAVVLIVSIPAVADDITVECEAEDGGTCKEMISYSSDQYEDDSELEEEVPVDPVIPESDGECFPFCGVEYWPW